MMQGHLEEAVPQQGLVATVEQTLVEPIKKLLPESLTHPPQATPGSSTSTINTTPQDTMPRLASAQPPTPTAAMGHDKKQTSPFAQDSIPDTARVVDQDQGARKMGQGVDQQKGEEAGTPSTGILGAIRRMVQ
jgi:hypothetical protein